MKTMIELGDSLLAEAKRVATVENTTLRALVEAGLREVLGKRRRRAAPFRLQRVTAKGKGLRPELQGASWQQLRDMAYGDPAPHGHDGARTDGRTHGAVQPGHGGRVLASDWRHVDGRVPMGACRRQSA